MNKDWPGRPLYEKAYVTAYFASRQWIRAARGWLGDDALWARAQRLAAPTASASMTRDHRTSHIVPVWASLEEDDYLYGFDDDGDVNAFDRNTAVSFGYRPGPEITREDTGGSGSPGA